MHDLVIKGGRVVDGTGAPAFTADVAVDDGRITQVGRVNESGRETIDGDGLVVTPGFIDTHTHYDGQATWDPLLTSSAWHGVTTVTMGNCGVGFAPVRAEERDRLIELMEGVEEIPGSILSQGIRWGWETFPEYMDFLDTVPKALDVTCQIPHAPVRTYVMGDERSVEEPATPDEITRMAALVGEAIEAGAWGFSTSRTRLHRSSSGKFAPGTLASEEEIFGIAQAMKAAGRGVVEAAQEGIVGEGEDPVGDTRRELDWMGRLSTYLGQTVIYTLQQNNTHPEAYREALRLTHEANAAGARLRGMSSARPIGALIGAKIPGRGFNAISYFNPLRFRPSYKALVDLPSAEMIRRLRDPVIKARILAEEPVYDDDALGRALGNDPIETLKKYFLISDPVNYEPTADCSLASLAAAARRDPIEFLYDQLVDNDGDNLFLVPLLNYSYGNSDALHEMLVDPYTLLGLGDGGAHVQNLCDASNTTYMLSHWVRDRTRGERISLEFAVRKLTSEAALAWGMSDRGVIAPGLKADLNVIDMDTIDVGVPQVSFDLPGGGQRITQTSRGYVATINAGTVVVRESVETGARPGRVVRSGRERPGGRS